jgi:serine/threonine protein phosphatase PrpC
MDLLCACRTDVGRVRTNNEDNYAEDRQRGIFVVCDGMGGHNAGEVASQLAAAAVTQHLVNGAHLRARYTSTGSFDDLLALQTHMQQALAVANQRIYTQSQNNPQQRGMGTTCTALCLVARRKGIVGHIGDSRLYLLRDGVLYQLTVDHTYVNELVKRGALTPEQAADHPQSNILSRAMGVQADVPVQTWTFDYDPGDTFFLCSDGIYNYFPDNVGLGARMGHDDLALGLSGIIDTALNRGGHDNCTGIIVRVPPEASPTPSTGPEYARLLHTSPLFSPLTPLEQLAVMGLGQREVLAPEAIIMAAGTIMDGFMMVIKGAVQIRRDTQVVRQLGPGDALGQTSLLGPLQQPDAVVASTASEVLRLSHRAFRHIVRQDPEIGSKLLGAMLRTVGGDEADDAPADGVG